MSSGSSHRYNNQCSYEISFQLINLALNILTQRYSSMIIRCSDQMIPSFLVSRQPGNNAYWQDSNASKLLKSVMVVILCFWNHHIVCDVGFMNLPVDFLALPVRLNAYRILEAAMMLVKMIPQSRKWSRSSAITLPVLACLTHYLKKMRLVEKTITQMILASAMSARLWIILASTEDLKTSVSQPYFNYRQNLSP